MPDGINLFVQDVRTSSIIVDLVALAPLALPFAEHANTVVDFAAHLKTAVNALLGRGTEPMELARHTHENIARFVEPVAKDNGAQVIVAGSVKGDVNVHFHVNSLEANAVQNKASRALHLLKAPATGFHEKVVLYLHQARNDPKSSAGDRGIIESIHPGPVKLTFASERLKQLAISGAENPFRSAFIVDVQVETVKGRPALYKVTQLHETIERPTEGEAA